MFKDYSFFNYLFDENGNLDESIMNGLIGKSFENAKLYYETKTHKYFLYSFKDGKSKLFLKTLKTKNDKLEFEDFQTCFIYDKPIQLKIESINNKDGRCALMHDNKTLMIVTMDPLDHKEGDIVDVYINWFPSKIELRKNKEDFYNHMNGKNGELNTFDWEIGDVVPVIAIIKGDKEHYPNVKQELLDEFDESFMVGSGNITECNTIISTMEVEENAGLENNELPIGKYDYYEFKTNDGIMSALVDEDILKMFFDKEKIDGIKIDKNSIIKVYGQIAGIIKK